MIIAPSRAEKQAARTARRTRLAPWFTALLTTTSVLALTASVWGALHQWGPIVWAGVCVFVVAGWFGGGRLIGKVDDPT